VIRGVSKVVVPVDNQDEATKFWTQRIGFRLLRDETYRGERWIEVAPADRSVVLVLRRRPATEPRHEVPNALAIPRVFVSCDHIEQTYAELRETGVRFLTGPGPLHTGWGVTFHDLEGNRFILEQRGWRSDVDRRVKHATSQVRYDEPCGSQPVQANTPPARLRVGAYSMVFHHLAGQSIEQHCHPAWKIIIPDAGQVAWKIGHRPVMKNAGVIFPPQLPHTAVTAAQYALILIDPWFLGLGPGHGDAIPLDPTAVEQIRNLWDQHDDKADDQARATVAFLRRRAVLPYAVSVDPRVAAALRDLPMARAIPHLAAAVGLSPSRLRALIRDQTGAPPAQLRRWQRLRAAIVSLQQKQIATAALDAGFADQAHLTRTATRLLGQTPRELADALSSVPALPRQNPSQAQNRDIASVKPRMAAEL
jgi:AraC-like DNA-binding protein/catechol 2,3-dioxygenase-like lactoylglutathione lyase family enzyme